MAQSVTLDQAVSQIVQLGDAIAQLRTKVGNLESDNRELCQQLSDARNGTANRDSPGKSELRSMKAAYPEKFGPKNDVFKAWTEDFERWMAIETPEAGELLKKAAHSKEAVAMPSGLAADDLRVCYSHLKKLMGDRESKSIIRNARHSNALEAYRLLHRRYNPRTAAQKSAALRMCTNFDENHKNSKVTEVSDFILQLERLNGEHFETYGAHCLTEEACKDTLRQIAPQYLEKAINLALVGRPEQEITYALLKDTILEYALNKEGHSPISVGQVDEKDEESTEDVRSAGSPKGLGAGKGLGNKGKGKGKGDGTTGKSMPLGASRICWELGHYARDCPLWKPPKSKGKGTACKGKGKGGKGKGKGRKGGVNGVDKSWEEGTEEECGEYEADTKVDGAEMSGAVWDLPSGNNFGVHCIIEVSDEPNGGTSFLYQSVIPEPPRFEPYSCTGFQIACTHSPISCAHSPALPTGICLSTSLDSLSTPAHLRGWRHNTINVEPNDHDKTSESEEMHETSMVEIRRSKHVRGRKFMATYAKCCTDEACTNGDTHKLDRHTGHSHEQDCTAYSDTFDSLTLCATDLCSASFGIDSCSSICRSGSTQLTNKLSPACRVGNAYMTGSVESSKACGPKTDPGKPPPIHNLIGNDIGYISDSNFETEFIQTIGCAKSDGADSDGNSDGDASELEQPLSMWKAKKKQEKPFEILEQTLKFSMTPTASSSPVEQRRRPHYGWNRTGARRGSRSNRTPSLRHGGRTQGRIPGRRRIRGQMGPSQPRQQARTTLLSISKPWSIGVSLAKRKSQCSRRMLAMISSTSFRILSRWWQTNRPSRQSPWSLTSCHQRSRLRARERHQGRHPR